MSAGRGYNTFHGFDTGPPPPGSMPGQFTAAHPVSPAFGWPTQPFGWPAFAAPAATPSYLHPHVYPYPGMAHPAMPPITDGGFPGIHLRNHTGGVGLPPGYDYAFPKEHTRIHVFTTKEKPWQNVTPLWNWDGSKHVKLLVPSNTTVKELMQNLGATNENPKKNVLHELTEAGGGKWVKGLTIIGDDKDRVKKAIREFGWDKSRTVWLYITKD